MKARERLEKRNRLVEKLRRADAQLRNEADKGVSSPSRRSKADFERAVDRRAHLAQSIMNLGGWPWRLNLKTGEFDGFLPPWDDDEDDVL